MVLSIAEFIVVFEDDEWPKQLSNHASIYVLKFLDELEQR